MSRIRIGQVIVHRNLFLPRTPLARHIDGTGRRPAERGPGRRAARHPPGAPTIGAVSAATPTDPAGTVRPSGPPAGPVRAGPDHVHDVLVVGGGPSGSSCAYWLAEAGWDVALVEKKVFPREKTCGDGLTPRSVRQIADMGVEGALAGAHRFSGLRTHAYGKVLDLPWPEHPSFPSYGYVITRHDLDAVVNERAVKAGATVWQGTEAVEPILGTTGPPARGAGSSAPVGDRAEPAPLLRRGGGQGQGHRRRPVRSGPGTWWWPTGPTRGSAAPSARRRDRSQPMGMALRGYYTSPGHDQPFIESHLDIRDDDGKVVPGYGWIFPLGDGRVNVGVGLLSTDRRWKGVNTSTLMEHFVTWAPKEWELSPATCLGPPTGGKLPMGLAVGPRVGATTLVVGDAAGSINPFNGEGIAYGYETGRLAAASLGEALSGRRRRGARPRTRPGSRMPTGSTTGWPGPSSG